MKKLIVAALLLAGCQQATWSDVDTKAMELASGGKTVEVQDRRPPPGPRPGGPGGPPPARKHTETSKGELKLVKADQEPGFENEVKIEVNDKEKLRIITCNSIPKHKVGKFPNAGNPNRIEKQSITWKLPLNPKQNDDATAFDLGTFGVGVNGVIFDPQAAEWYLGDRDSGWQYDALGGAVALGLDENYAHVQPNGLYHYHGLPGGLLENLEFTKGKHSPLVGYALDGFPIYAVYGNGEKGVQEFKSSYRLKKGKRPDGKGEPGGKYDGTFLADYEYVKDLGDLDECNGKFVKTPEYPDGTYAYFLTKEFPVVPRKFKGTPVKGAIKK